MRATKPLYIELATLVQRQRNLADRISAAIHSSNGAERDRCLAMKNQVEDEICRLLKEYLPSGSGVDGGTTLNTGGCFRAGHSRLLCLALSAGFHHMDDQGSYVKWTEHTIQVIPDMVSGFTLNIGGPNYRQIKDYLFDLYGQALQQVVPVAPCVGLEPNDPVLIKPSIVIELEGGLLQTVYATEQADVLFFDEVTDPTGVKMAALTPKLTQVY